MNPLTLALIFLGICYGFWLHFLIFSAYRAAVDAGRVVPLVAKILIAPVLIGGALIDVTFNTLFGWMIYAEAPFKGYVIDTASFNHTFTSWTLTYRCDRHLSDTDWRGTLARFLCSKFLDPFETGGHCKGCK